MQATYFAALGVSPTASVREIRSAYMALAKRFHPDINPSESQRFTLMTAAFNALRNENDVDAYARRVRMDWLSRSEHGGALSGRHLTVTVHHPGPNVSTAPSPALAATPPSPARAAAQPVTPRTAT